MSFFDFPLYDIPTSVEGQMITKAGPHIYVHRDDYSEASQSLLTKILAAAKYELSSLEVSRLSPEDNYKVLDRGLAEDQLVISFGLGPQRLGLNCDGAPYVLLRLGGKSVLFCHRLEQIAGDAMMKKALWGALKSFYNL